MKTTLKESQSCPNCGQPMPVGALAGLCPACLLAQGVESDPGETVRNRRFEPLSLEAVAGLFPQLEIQGLLGAGGMGAVYRARQRSLDRVVALKILPAIDGDGAGFTERFNREARALARLNHPNIVAVYEFGAAGGMHYFIMEFVDGANLRQLERAGRLSHREALQIIPQICDALQYAHDEGVVHRDIKPENVLVDRKGRVKIADFGLAKILGHDAESLRLTAEGQVMGTPHYMAPEQVERPLAVDHRADIYSLGVVFYEMLTGDLPLGKFPPPSRKVQVDVRLDDVVLRALENDPERRYQHASEVKSQVEAITGTPAPAAPSKVASVASENVKASGKRFVRRMGFPLVAEEEGGRRVHVPGVLHALAIGFAILTVGFGLVSLATGDSLMGWLGVVGLPGVVVRLVLAIGVVGWALRSAWTAQDLPPRAVDDRHESAPGTVVAVPERLSVKAVIGAVWVAVAFVAFAMWIAPIHFESVATGGGGMPVSAGTSIRWWQWILIVTILLPGLVAPFGATIMGWLAVGDIRRARGRLGGLGLAVFDGLCFPLLALDGLLAWVLVEVYRAVRGGAGADLAFVERPAILLGLGIALICLVVDWLVVRRVWQGIRATAKNPRGSAGDWWWSRRHGGMVLAASCVLILVAVGQRRQQPGIFKFAPEQVAKPGGPTGGWVAQLPKGATVELVAVSNPGAPPDGWWSPRGEPITGTRFEVRNAPFAAWDGRTSKRLILHWRGLPPDATGPAVEFDSGSNGSTGGEVWRDGQRWPDATGVSGAFPLGAASTSFRVGFSFGLWQTLSTHPAIGNPTTYTLLPECLNPYARVHELREDDGRLVLTMTMGPVDRNWNMRVVAVGTDGVEHGYQTAAVTSSAASMTWTYRFALARDDVKDFLVQVRPVHWVELREVALRPRGTGEATKGADAARALRFGPVRTERFSDLLDLDTGRTGRAPMPKAGGNPIADWGDGLEWMQENGFDVMASHDKLEALSVKIVDLAAADWDALAGEGLIRELAERGTFRVELKPAGGKLPATFGFRTRESGTGLLQIVALDEPKGGATVRFKSIEVGR